MAWFLHVNTETKRETCNRNLYCKNGGLSVDRLTRLKEEIAKEGLDGLVITNHTNRRYMTGFTGSEGIVLISPNEAKIIVDFRYFSQVKDEVSQLEIIESESSVFKQVISEVKKMKIKKLGYEEEDMTCSVYRKYQESLEGIELVPTAGLIEKLRVEKDESEWESLKKAANIADKTFEHILGFIKPGVTEKEIALEMEFFMRKEGADSSSFDMIIASGVRSALPHGQPTNKKVERGEMITLDFGALYEGYRSDITRTIALGEPDEQLKEIYQIVLESQIHCIKGVKPGIGCDEVDKLARDYIKSKGYGSYFGHGTGHGIGLDIHEGPSLSSQSKEILAPGMVITIEPGIYLPNIGGVRIEDDVLVTPTGYEVLTKSPKELIVI